MKPEDQNTEYKQTWRDEYLKWICGFANAQGGKLLVGVRDDGTICGVEKPKKLLEDIPNQMRESLGIIADVNMISLSEKQIIEISVPPYPMGISFRGVYYVRKGATNQRLDGMELERFLLKRRGLNWENLPCPGLKTKDISTTEIKKFKRMAIERGRLSSAVLKDSKSDFLANLHLVAPDGISYAAALLFTERAEKWIPGAFVRVGKFGKDDADLLFQDEVHGSLLNQVEKTIELLHFKYLKAKISYPDVLHRKEKFPFPEEAIRELLLNALVHKDYASSVPVQISVYDDRLYIANCGMLPENWTEGTLLGKHSSKPYNPTIASCVYLTGEIETWGRGIEKVQSSCRKHGCGKLKYDIHGSDLMVLVSAAEDAIMKDTPRLPDTNHDTNDTNHDTNDVVSSDDAIKALDTRIIEAISSNPHISMCDIATVCGVSRPTIARALKQLKAMNRIVRVGGTRGHWEVVG